MSGNDVYEVYAIRYATVSERQRKDNFIFVDGHDGPMPIDFYVWAIVGKDRTFVVDLGFSAEDAAARGRLLERTPAEGLKLVGVDAAEVKDVIVTHLHWDHAGNHHEFPNARFHLQDREMAYATGRHMQHDALRRFFTVEPVIGMVREVYNGRVDFYDGDAELAPGISVHLIGGHTMGLQVVRVNTRRGQVVLASDGAHFYDNMLDGNPFPVVYNVADMLAGHKKVYSLADTPNHVIPGHDPQVRAFYPAVSSEAEGIAVRLDVDPAL
ncbi:MAG: N-acyl homoserine lactonase family protein [Minwuiales bacterium]|nr:N-acyl homoserine lactonase family protein [Minwuiales bacterium]